ncbi:c-type cytochrome [Fuscovulum blasticum]|uniref:c-type cytochrome n=1 Tax=Fuscovulum blasticum TaxID=1075 RepID=UPI000D3E6D49|nr:cytochrome c [Fuscovulum blasticum]AWD23087.1 cytochrome C [Fuscovulum blasticum]
MKRMILAMAALWLAACVPQEKPTGAEDFAAFCSSCHGAGGKGDGPMAADLEHKPADLTGLSRRNGGTFPKLRVMAKIWGYTGGKNGAAIMPNFGPLLDSPLVPYDSGDGIQSPTPERLVQLAEYVETLQKK